MDALRDLRDKIARRAMIGLIVLPALSVQHALLVGGGRQSKAAVVAIAAVVAARAARTYATTEAVPAPLTEVEITTGGTKPMKLVACCRPAMRPPPMR